VSVYLHRHLISHRLLRRRLDLFKANQKNDQMAEWSLPEDIETYFCLNRQDFIISISEAFSPSPSSVLRVDIDRGNGETERGSLYMRSFRLIWRLIGTERQRRIFLWPPDVNFSSAAVHTIRTPIFEENSKFVPKKLSCELNIFSFLLKLFHQ